MTHLNSMGALEGGGNNLTRQKEDWKFRVIVAIDFGTDGTALSFANKETNEVYPRKVWYVIYFIL